MVSAEINTGSSGLTVYFLDVGQGDGAMVVCDGDAMLIDGGGSAESDYIYAFLKKHKIARLKYIVATHPHEDHAGGLSGALNFAAASAAFSPVAEYYGAAFDNFTKYLKKQNVELTIPKSGDAYMLGNANIYMINPVNSSDITNNSSLVLRISYGKTSFLFTGDAERAEEREILEEGHNISSTVLKVAHHGSDTSTTYPFLREVMPKFAVISCGKDNAYGHPDENVLSRLRDANAIVYRTDLHGMITCVSDGEYVRFTFEKSPGDDADQTIWKNLAVN
jgi:competence protein ComEC